MKAVNVDDVLKILHKYGKYIFVTDEKKYSDMADEIANLKALEQEPKTGHWIVNEWSNIYCSECGCTALYNKVYPGESVFGKAVRVKSTFCPTCGAKMGREET